MISGVELLPLAVFGDFNEILLLFELQGGVFSLAKVVVFSRMVDVWGFVDLDALGDKFTWVSNTTRGVRISKRLNRGMGDSRWRV